MKLKKKINSFFLKNKDKIETAGQVWSGVCGLDVSNVLISISRFLVIIEGWKVFWFPKRYNQVLIPESSECDLFEKESLQM